ncbi:MAG: hypothetical protein M3R01_02475 [Actinomycetota bacterium]|nr:hypothetical protein [Actinomycetota bacterium]
MTGDDRAREGLDHLQTAALELIAATRAFLDLAEGLVREPGAASVVVETVTAMVADARRPPRPPDGPPEPAGPGERPEPGIRPIRLS